jgi:hypothetical protein
MPNLKTVIMMNQILLAGVSIPAITLTLLMVLLYQSIKKSYFNPKKSKCSVTPTSNEKVDMKDKNRNTEFNHRDFSGGFLGI